MNGLVVLAVLSEARKKFGTFDKSNSAQIARWVKRRIVELDGSNAEIQPFTPRDFDYKKRAAHDG